MLKRKINKEAFDKLSKDIQAVYTAEGEDYLLDLEGVDDVDELRRAKDRETTAAKDLRKQLKDAQKKLQEFEDDQDPDKRQTDLEKKIEAGLKKAVAKRETELAEKETELATKLANRDAATKRSMVEAAAATLAAKISNSPSIMAKIVAERLSVDFEGDDPKLVILGKDGKSSSLTMEQLSKEIVANKEYAAIVAATKASGSGAPRNGNQQNQLPPSGAGGGDGKPPDLSKMEPKALAAFLKEQREARQTS